MSALMHDPEPFGEDDTCDPDPLPADAWRMAADRRSEFVELTHRLANDVARFGRWVMDHPDLPVPYVPVLAVREKVGEPLVRFSIHVGNWPYDTADEMTRLGRILGSDDTPLLVHSDDETQRYERRFGLVALEVWATHANLRRAA